MKNTSRPKNSTEPGTTTVALRRRMLDLQQGELAKRLGITRQFLSLVEAGRTQPNVRLALQWAAELGTSVEDLFGEATLVKGEGLPVDLLTEGLPSGARLNLAHIGERWVAQAADSSTGLGGGFSEADALLSWVGGKPHALPHRRPYELEQNIALAGCDPALALLRGNNGGPGLAGRCFWINCGSARALQLLAEGAVHAAGLHYATGDGDENLREVRKRDPKKRWQLFHFTRWEQGWMLRPDSAATGRFRGTEDLLNASFRRLANRETGAGSRRLLDFELEKAGISSSIISGYTTELSSHWDCARALLDNKADVAIGPRAIASVFGLGFVPIAEVAFDLAVPREHLTHPQIEALFHRLRSKGFQRELSTLPGYQPAITAGAALSG